MKKAVLISLFLAESVLAMPPAQRHAFPRQDGAQNKQAGQKDFTKDMDCMIGSYNGEIKDSCVKEARQKVTACNTQQTTKQCIEGPWLEMFDCSSGATVPQLAKLNPDCKPESTSTGQAETGTTGKGPEVSNKPDSTSPIQAEDEATDKDTEGPTSTGPGTPMTEQDTEYSNLWKDKCLAPSLKAGKECRNIQDFGQKCERTRNENDMKCLLDNSKARAKTDFVHNVCISAAVFGANDCFYTNNKGKTLPQCQREQWGAYPECVKKHEPQDTATQSPQHECSTSTS
ncbi:hypothetical protein X797_012421 [Metarhizium robertsii]|uniref:Uncharacterized protein n=1 Tax=Metarhizium robertsii TaxID=568076 RepID=A0A014N493_9HYPO|nr:hypothetical protein X797_012421 [Metarhizium robertsii]